ncbi:LysR family transcriptional regulator ArgP [Solicola sp. PLA-1-18]|uniref:LysR family transcriptional regulator ArgP n=1 Tax=Solicola sp. PLA-1-18 TaxID=3380532 RepID=UPI003B776B6E
MHVDPARLDALAAVVRTGTFDAAARELHVTPSAVSQRVKALEGSVGQVLVSRAKPCTPTAAGEALVRLAGQVDLLSRDAVAALAGDAARPQAVTVVVNADSLSTWFVGALAMLRDSPTRFWVEQEDEAHSAALLRDGTATAAVTSDSRAVQGCRVEPLGALRYVAVASPDVVASHLRGRPLARALPVAPRVEFNAKDSLQELFLDRLGADPARDRGLWHRVPSSSGIIDAIRAGLGWGMAPQVAVAADLASGGLVRVAPRHRLDVPLFWQHWRVRSPTLDALTHAVRTAASTSLVPPPP